MIFTDDDRLYAPRSRVLGMARARDNSTLRAARVARSVSRRAKDNKPTLPTVKFGKEETKP